MEVVVAEGKKDRPSDPGGDEQKPVLHVYDGDLQEEDNQLPNWWLWLFYGTITFAAVYWLVVHDMKLVSLPGESYDKELAAAQSAESQKSMSMGAVTPDALLAMSKDATVVAQGKEVFAGNCVACHKADAGGVVGPNLTDPYWLHGGAPDKIYVSVRNGWPDKGMPTWVGQLGEEKVRAVTAYVLTLKNTNVAGGKAPQGDKE
jgi:cytochrome c oxidase cbb3-type subunit 3